MDFIYAYLEASACVCAVSIKPPSVSNGGVMRIQEAHIAMSSEIIFWKYNFGLGTPLLKEKVCVSFKLLEMTRSTLFLP